MLAMLILASCRQRLYRDLVSGVCFIYAMEGTLREFFGRINVFDPNMQKMKCPNLLLSLFVGIIVSGCVQNAGTRDLRFDNNLIETGTDNNAKSNFSKMKKISIFCACIGLITSGCNNTGKMDATTGFPTKTIQWELRKDFEIKDIVKDIHYVILEDSPESMFYEIDKLIIKNDRIYVLSIGPIHELLTFDIEGNFLYKISRQGNGPGEYTRFINFTVDKNNNVFVLCLTKRSIMKFDKNGEYVSAENSLFSFRDFVIINDNQHLLSLDKYGENNANRKVVLTTDFNKSEDMFLYFHQDSKDNKFNTVRFQPSGDKIAYMRPINDTLFIFDNRGSLTQAWHFDFGKRKLTEHLKNDFEKVAGEVISEGQHSAYITNTPICIKNYIFMEIVVDGQGCISVYDTSKNKIAYEILKPETFSLYNINTPLYAVSDSVLASWFSSSSYLFLKESLGSFSINPDVDAHLEKGGTIILLNTIKFE